MTELKLQAPGYTGGMTQENKVIWGAVAASVLLHVLLVGSTWNLSFKPTAEDVPLRDTSQDVELVFEAFPDEEGPQSEQPKTYVSVPERHAAEEAPEDPDYLALYHSVAADNKLGDSDQPSADEDGEFDMVAIRKQELNGAGGVEYSQQPQPENKPATSQQESGAQGTAEAVAEVDGDHQEPGGEWALPEEEKDPGGQSEGAGADEITEESPDLENWWGGRSNPSILKQGEEGSTGDRGFDFNQPASGSMTSGVAVIDEFQLSTVQWDWAPWIQVFGNELHRHWVSPYAYRLGLINGTTVIRLVVEKDGRPSSMVMLDQDGHESLHAASLAALKAFAPYLPLPEHFPEENLVITLSLHYPAFRR